MGTVAIVTGSTDPRVGPPLIINHNGRQLSVGRPPSIKQWAFINRCEKEQLYGGSKSGGKSRALCAKLVMMAISFPNNQGGLFRKDLTDLKGSTLVTFEQMCPRELIVQHHRTDHYFILKTCVPDKCSAGRRVEQGCTCTKLWYGGLGEMVDFESAKGKEYGFFAIDEPSEIDLQVYLQMLAQLRWTLPDGFGTHDDESDCWRPPYQAMLGSNPEPGWLEDHFGHLISRANPDTPIVTDGERVYIQALPRDNPYNPPQWEEVMRNTPDIPRSWVEKYLEGSWKASEGQVFKEFDEDTHCISVPLPEYLKRLKLIASLDHATTGITCFCINGVDPDDNIVALASHYAKNKLISEHSAAIRDLCDKWVRMCGKEEEAQKKFSYDKHVHWSLHAFEYILIDPSTEAKTQQSQNELISVQELYRREGIPTQPAWNALESGIKLMEEYIHVKPSHIHPIVADKRGSPSYFVVRDWNQDGIKEIISWKRTITVNKTIKYVGKDHWIDNQRYIINSRPEPPRFTASDILKMDAHSQRAARAMAKFDKSFGKAGVTDQNQWFPGGTSDANQWFDKVN